jgi:hypothetical protein
LQRNAIDWYAFIKTTEFWYDPMYYVQASVMPETVFMKYLNQAQRAADWGAVVSACEARFVLDKRGCSSEIILNAWIEAEKKVKNR